MSIVSISILLVGIVIVFGINDELISAAGVDESGRPLVPSTESAQDLTRFGFISEVPDSVNSAAQIGLRPFWESILSTDSKRYGFPPGSDFKSISLGQPYRVMTILPEELFAYRTGEDIRTKLRETTMWFFPVFYEGIPKIILTVDLVGGRWKAVAIGGAGLAAQLHELEQAWPENDSRRNILVRIFQATSDIVIVADRDAVVVVPLESARISLELYAPDKTAFDSWQVDEIIQRLIPVVRTNINRPVE
jgi:hypothetical protein